VVRLARGTAAIAALALAATAQLAGAQVGGGSPGGTGRGGPGGPGATGGMGRHTPAGGDPRVDARPEAQTVSADQLRVRMLELEDTLLITAAQEAAWRAFSDRALKLADDIARSRWSTRYVEGTVQEQLDRLVETARDRADAVEALADAGRRMYATLTPEQRALADRQLARALAPLVVGPQATGAARTPAAAPSPGTAPPR
jgi:hypothetical protein